jgi:hypothetical protein
MKECEVALLKRKVQVTFEMDLEVTEIPPGEIQVMDEHRRPSPKYSAELTAYLNELIQAIIADPAILPAYLKRATVQEIEGIRLDTLERLVPEMRGNEEDMLTPLLPRLSAAAQEYFQYALDNDQWSDSTEEMYDHFKVTLTSCTITGI